MGVALIGPSFGNAMIRCCRIAPLAIAIVLAALASPVGAAPALGGGGATATIVKMEARSPPSAPARFRFHQTGFGVGRAMG
jgi:hypothetical protein